jgi:hypothetical protein
LESNLGERLGATTGFLLGDLLFLADFLGALLRVGDFFCVFRGMFAMLLAVLF